MSAASFGEIDGVKISVAIFLIFIRIVPEDIKEDVFEIHLSDFEKSEVSIPQYEPDPRNICMIQDLIEKIDRDESFPFKAACMFLYPQLKLHYKDELKKMMNLADVIANKAEQYSDNDDILVFACKCINDFISKNENVKNKINAADVNRYVLRIGDIAFVSSNLFKRIMLPVLEVSQMDIIKNQLQSVGVIEGKIGDYTVKKLIAENKRLRFIKFNLVKIFKILNSDIGEF